MKQPKICVVGASNMDLISYAPRLPKMGETLPGTSFQTGFGGKGANQAVMAAKLGAEVQMVTKLGKDSFGRDYLKNYEDLNFNTDYISFTDEASTGVAPIWVDGETGNNAIIVISGANELLSPADVEAARSAIAQSQLLLCQWECRLETSLAALRIAREEGVTTLFNPAPARADLPDEAFVLSDIFCVNETETEILTGLMVETLPQAEAAARVMLARGARNILLTLGERGSLLVNADEVIHAAAPEVKAIDTTGAGDAFCGSLAYFLASDVALADAIFLANHVAAVSVQAEGTQSSFPRVDELPDEMFREQG